MTTNHEQPILTPRHVLDVVQRRKWLIILPVVVVTLVALVGSYFIPPRYESSILVWIGNPVKLTRDLERLIGQFQDIVLPERSVGRDVREYSRQIASMPYAAEIMDKLKFPERPEFVAQADALAAGQPDLTPRDRMVMVMRGRLADQVKLEFVTNSHLKITAEERDSYGARDLAQAIGEVFVQEQAKQELKLLFLSLTFTSEQLARYDKQLKQKLDEKTDLEKEIAKWQTDNVLTAEPNRNNLTSEIERRGQEILDLESRAGALQARLDRLGDASFRVEEPRTLRSKKEQIAELVGSFKDLVQDHLWVDPAINNLALRIVRLEDDVETAHALLVREQYGTQEARVQQDLVDQLNVLHRIEVLQLLVKALTAGRLALDNKRGSLPEYRAQLEQLDRELKAMEALRDQFRVQQEGFEISQDLIQETRFQIVEDARVQSQPTWPDRRILLALGVLLGMLVGAGAVFVVEYSDRSLKDPSTAEAVLGVPVLAVIPQLRPND